MDVSTGAYAIPYEEKENGLTVGDLGFNVILILPSVFGRPQKIQSAHEGVLELASGADVQCNLLNCFEADPFPGLSVENRPRIRARICLSISPKVSPETSGTLVLLHAGAYARPPLKKRTLHEDV